MEAELLGCRMQGLAQGKERLTVQEGVVNSEKISMYPRCTSHAQALACI